MKIHRYFTKKIKGFGLIEILVGVTILSVSFVGIVAVGQAFLRLSSQSTQETQANFLLEEGGEVLRSFRDNGWVNIAALTPEIPYYIVFSDGKWATSTVPVLVDDRFERKFFVSNVNRDINDNIASSGTEDAGTKKITLTVSWKMPIGTNTKTVMFYLSDI